ncbi:MAG: DUF1638 domain-containing protein [Verrucomicrobia bacterium]|nr:DUF1638 domain-containing protein [Verrucomicrobiota bacterium]MDA1086520.1 DUF1638 domain-containing protein [Verrucomicrobiota bacterium]
MPKSGDDAAPPAGGQPEDKVACAAPEWRRRKLHLVSCEIFFREMCLALSRTPNQVDAAFLPKGLHDIAPEKMLEHVQAAVDAIKFENYEAVIIGYALCNNGLAGLTAREIPLVMPRAHDCITLFLGSRERYQDYFFKNPGVYFKTTGWIERNRVDDGELQQLSIPNQQGMNQTYEEMVEKYGADNAEFLYTQLYDHTRNYSKYTYIEMGLEQDANYKAQTHDEAKERGWEFENVEGDISMIQRLVDGQWASDEFLVVPPGHRLTPTGDETIVRTEKAP